MRPVMRGLGLGLSGILLLSSLTFAGTIEVPGDFPTIQGAIDAAFDGDTVVVSPGTYLENLDFVGKAITVRSLEGPATTIIDGNTPQLGSVVRFMLGEGNDSVIEGFTLTGGIGFSPGAIPSGAGILCFFTAPTIRNNIIVDNNAPGFGGGMYLIGSNGAVIAGNIIADNTAVSGGGITLQDCSNTVIVNNTIVDNLALMGSSGGVDNLGSIGTTITNTIAVGNQFPNLFDSTGSMTVTYSIVEGGWPGVGNLDLDPFFVDPVAGDYHLGDLSPAIDAGAPVAAQVPPVDLDGDPRPACGATDIGADEVLLCAQFRRGDADADGSFNGLVDAVFVLNFQFVPGSPEPPCLDAADADDSGTFNGLVDGLLILNFQFQPGSPPPPAPGPFNCDVDPTDDDLECPNYDCS